MSKSDKFVIRIRSNYGIWKIPLSNDQITLGELQSLLHSQYKVSLDALEHLQTDVTGSNFDTRLNSFKTLRELGITHGDILQLPKLKKIEIEKSTIEEGKLISAGTSYELDESELQVTDEKKDREGEQGKGTKSSNEGNEMKGKKEDGRPQAAVLPSRPTEIAPPKSVENPYTAQVKERSQAKPIEPAKATPEVSESRSHIRPPDQAKRMMLYGEEESDSDESFSHPVQRSSPRQESVIDEDVINEMRQAGLTEEQIQEQIDYLLATRSDHETAREFSSEPRSPEVRPPDQAKRMRLFGDDDFVSEPILRLGLPSLRPVQRPPPRQESLPDEDVINEMRQAGLSEEQIQEQIDYHIASRLDQQAAVESSHTQFQLDPLEHIQRVHQQIEEANRAIARLDRGGITSHHVGIGTSTRTRGRHPAHLDPPFIDLSEVDEEERQLQAAIELSKAQSLPPPDAATPDPDPVVRPSEDVDLNRNPYDFRQVLDDSTPDDLYGFDDGFDLDLKMALTASLEQQNTRSSSHPQSHSARPGDAERLPQDSSMSTGRGNNISVDPKALSRISDLSSGPSDFPTRRTAPVRSAPSVPRATSHSQPSYSAPTKTSLARSVGSEHSSRPSSASSQPRRDSRERHTIISPRTNETNQYSHSSRTRTTQSDARSARIGLSKGESGSIPPSLRSAEEDHLSLAMARSLNQEEEDEAYAKALQDSLNEL